MTRALTCALTRAPTCALTRAIHRRAAATTVAALLLAVSPVSPPASAAPVRPTDDAAVLAVVPAGLGGGSAFRAAERALAAAPGDRALAVAFARAAIEEGRVRGDPRLYGRAQAALAPWWGMADPPQDVRLLRAVIRQAGHDFSGALADLDHLVAADPGDAGARLSRAGVRLVTGDIAGALEDCAAARPAGGPLPGLVCRARAGAAMGEGERAFAGLIRAIAAYGATDPVQTRFARMAAADIAAGLGRTEDADRLSAAALEHSPTRRMDVVDASKLPLAGSGALSDRPDDSVRSERALDGDPDVPALAIRAGILLDAGRPRDVLALLADAGSQDVLVLARAEAAKALGDPSLDGLVALLEERFAAAAGAGSTLHRREEARFRLSVLGDAAAALPLAVDNFAVQKEGADIRLLLEAALAAGRPDAARPALDVVRTTGLADVRLVPLLRALTGRPS